jgi:hypothetical protein
MASGIPCRRIHEPTNEQLRLWLSSVKKLFLLHRSSRLVRAELQITDAAGSAIPCLYLGEGVSLDYYRKLYRCPDRSPARPISITKLIREIHEARARFPVILVETNQLLRCLLPDGGLLTYPWIRQQADLASEKYLRRQRGIERRYGQIVRNRAYERRFSQASSDLELFHRIFHLPHILARHADLAAVRTLSQLNKALPSGFLLQVWRGSRWVSGLVAERVSADKICPLAVGLHRDFPEERQKGAVAAAYYFLFQWARKNGVRIVDLGGSRPHLMDGVFYHKSLWGAQPMREPWHHTAIMFYLDPAASLPDLVTQQLIWNKHRFGTIEECLSTVPAAGAAQGSLHAVAPVGISGKLIR